MTTATINSLTPEQVQIRDLRDALEDAGRRARRCFYLARLIESDAFGALDRELVPIDEEERGQALAAVLAEELDQMIADLKQAAAPTAADEERATP